MTIWNNPKPPETRNGRPWDGISFWLRFALWFQQPNLEQACAYRSTSARASARYGGAQTRSDRLHANHQVFRQRFVDHQAAQVIKRVK
jgi:hypothetical protein